MNLPDGLPSFLYSYLGTCSQSIWNKVSIYSGGRVLSLRFPALVFLSHHYDLTWLLLMDYAIRLICSRVGSYVTTEHSYLCFYFILFLHWSEIVVSTNYSSHCFRTRFSPYCSLRHNAMFSMIIDSFIIIINLCSLQNYLSRISVEKVFPWPGRLGKSIKGRW